MTFGRPLLWGCAASCVVSAALLLLLAGVMTRYDLPGEYVDLLTIVVAALGAFAGGFICARAKREKGLLMGMLCGATLLLLLLLCALPMTGVAMSWLLPVKLLSLLLAGGVGGIVGVNHLGKHR